MNVLPLRKNVLIAENATTYKTTESGLILDGVNSTRDSKTATVLAIGPDVTQVTIGDKILLDWTKGTVVKVGDAQRAMIAENNIIAVLET